MKPKYSICGDFFKKPITGVQRFGLEITHALDEMVQPGEFEIVVKDKECIDREYKNISIVEYEGLFDGILWIYLDYSRYVHQNNTIAINLCNRAIPGTKSISCLHDITYKINRQFHRGFKNWLRTIWNCWNYYYITKHSRMLFTVSHFSESEIKKYYPKARYKSFVILPNAWEHIKNIEEDCKILNRLELIGSREYYFSVSSIAKNKNFKWILHQACLHPEKNFIIAGGGSLREFNDVPDNLIFTGYITDGELKALMSNCKAFIFPTLYEGFGIPPLEAIASGAKSIIVSDTPCMHEIYGEYASYIDPTNYSKAVDFNLCDRNVEELLEKYSWEKSARTLLDALHNY